MAKYNYTIEFTRNNGVSKLAIDPVALYGYWERKDGSEGGGLWFRKNADGKLELVDFDGSYEFPREWVTILRNAGYVLDWAFDN